MDIENRAYYLTGTYDVEQRRGLYRAESVNLLVINQRWLSLRLVELFLV
jgi:hypothetical protein